MSPKGKSAVIVSAVAAGVAAATAAAVVSVKKKASRKKNVANKIRYEGLNDAQILKQRKKGNV